MNMKKIDSYEWGDVWADERDPDAGGASHRYSVYGLENGVEKDYAGVSFQHGPRNEKDSVHGALDDHILAIAQDRMEGFQEGPFAHPANQEALNHIRAARAALRYRAEERRARGVLGKNEA